MTSDTPVPLQAGHTVRLGACLFLVDLQARGCCVTFDRAGLLAVEPCSQLTPMDRDTLARYAVDLALLLRHTVTDARGVGHERPQETAHA
jgi:hypothetical protein